MFDRERDLESKLEAMPEGPKPRDVACPYCNAKVGHSCGSTTSAYPARTHVARWEAVGISKPNLTDWDRDNADGNLRDLRRKLEAVPEMTWLKSRQSP
jgi:hypothetical protein